MSRLRSLGRTVADLASLISDVPGDTRARPPVSSRTRTARPAIRIRPIEAMLFFVVLAVLTTWAAFWVIRLAVRYGMNDALRMNRTWLVPESDRDATA